MNDDGLSSLIAAAALSQLATTQARETREVRAASAERERLEKERAAEAERARAAAARVEARRQRLSRANGGAIARLPLTVPYGIVYFFGFGASNVGNEFFVESTIIDALVAIVITAVVCVVICWVADFVVGRPRRWVTAIVVAVTFSIGWSMVAPDPTGATLPIIGATVGYLIAIAITQLVLSVSDQTTVEAPLNDTQRFWATWASVVACLGIPLAITQMVASVSPAAGLSVRNWVIDLYDDGWGWYQSLLGWFDGMSRLSDDASVAWTIPIMVAVFIVTAGGQPRENFPGRLSRIEALIVAASAVAMVIAIMLQWALAMTFAATLALIFGILGAMIAVFAFFAS
ncbi:hypothetical protein ACFQNE_13740 [Gordonia phosphorivorans]|uniref:Uncharacterized protein n=1 Tax=Gordonia phosphorivorans TaxID=1056982 RepID=A0ABV6HC92_9ACTN